MAICKEELEYMKQIILCQECEDLGLYDEIRGGEYWYFPLLTDPKQQGAGNSEILEDIEKRLYQSNRQNKQNKLTWIRLDHQSDVSKGQGLAISGLSRAQATKFAYKLRLKSILLITREQNFVVHSGYAEKSS